MNAPDILDTLAFSMSGADINDEQLLNASSITLTELGIAGAAVIDVYPGILRQMDKMTQRHGVGAEGETFGRSV